jgi:hypothetical protein
MRQLNVAHVISLLLSGVLLRVAYAGWELMDFLIKEVFK